MMADPFGTDVSSFKEGDLDPFFGLIAGARVIAEAIVRRWTTPEGGLFYDPSFGRDVRALIGQACTAQSLFALRAQLAAQAEEDERVLEATIDVALDIATRTLRIRGEIRTALGPFSLVVSIDQLSVELLEPS